MELIKRASRSLNSKLFPTHTHTHNHLAEFARYRVPSHEVNFATHLSWHRSSRTRVASTLAKSSPVSHFREFIFGMEMATVTDRTETRKPTSSLASSFPCELPEDKSLFLLSADFEQYVARTLADLKANKEVASSETLLAQLSVNQVDGEKFVDALRDASPTPKASDVEEALAAHNKTLTDNRDVTYKSTNSALLDLFTELEKVVSGDRLKELLDAAWKEDPLATLKIIWNARSIHLGKGEQESFYKCLGWMKNGHPVTVISNLQWLYRSVIEKKIKKDDEDAMVIVEKDEGENESDGFDVLHGVSHGYWKDLLNVLVLAANNGLEVGSDTRGILHKKNVPPKLKKRKRWETKSDLEADHLVDAKDRVDVASISYQELAKERKHALEHKRHENVLKLFEGPFYRCLHFSIARLFARQLQIDKKLLESEDSLNKLNISLAAKWAPSLEGFHDKHTLIATSIAEILYPRNRFSPEDSRELYLRRAREAYRAHYLAPLRRQLDVVERKITEEAFDKINYSKVPSLAMDAYKDLFVKKDFEHYEKYIEKVAAGKSRISGAVLLPGSLVHQAREKGSRGYSTTKSAKALMEAKMASVLSKTLDGQWASLVKRIKDNGSLSSTMAVCDVSGSMTGPSFPDQTCPLDHSIGLSLLIAEVTEKPFGGCIISFSSNPTVHSVGGSDDKRSLEDKVRRLERSHWEMNTDFVAVFERLILPMAIRHKIKPEDMVKQVMVFSDMQFDAAEQGYYQSNKKADQWDSSFDRIKRKYKEAGYEVPRLIFWNLAGGRHGVGPKPVTKDEGNCLMVSGYSQGMLKMFLDKGAFEEEEEEELEEIIKDEDGKVTTETVKKKVDPMSGVWKAIGHKAYDMLKVVD